MCTKCCKNLFFIVSTLFGLIFGLPDQTGFMSLRRRERKRDPNPTTRVLTREEKRLVEEFKKDCSLPAAKHRAKYYPDLEQPHNHLLKAAITEVMNENSKEIEVSHSDLLRRLKTWYDSDITQTVGLTKEELQALPEDVRKLITKYKYKKRRYKEKGEWVLEETFDCEFVSKEKAIDMVARHIGFFMKDNVQAQLEFDMSELSDNAMKELAKMLTS